MQNIYNAIRYLTPEQQGIILGNYKLTELYSILANNEGYEKYIKDLFAISKEYTQRAIALMALHTEACKDIMEKKKFNVVSSMIQVYDNMSEGDKKKFCEDMLQKKGFFQDAYKVMMDSFENAVEMKGDVAGSVVEK